MVAEDTANIVLKYLKKYGETNTFRLATELGVDRHKLLSILKKLEEKQAVEFRYGKVEFLKFPAKERKAKKITEKALKPRKAIAKIGINPLKKLEDENKELREKIKELEQKVKSPKVIRRTIVKKVPAVKKIYVKSKKLEEQAEHIAELEKTIEELKEKAATPKIIRRTIIKKVPVKVKEEPEEIRPKKFKIPKLSVTWLKNIQQLKRPEFMEWKTKIGKKINFLELNKNIQQLHIPETLRNP